MYQGVGTPRFYVSVLQWLNSLGKMAWSSSAFNGANMTLLNIDPSSVLTLTPRSDNASPGTDDHINFNTGIPLANIMPDKKNFAMTLGHNFTSAGAYLSVRTTGGEVVNNNESVANSGLVNDHTATTAAASDGFSINIGNDAGDMSGDVIKFRLDTAETIYTYPTSPNDDTYKGFVVQSGSSGGTFQYNYGSAVLEVNGAEQSPSTRGDLHGMLDGRVLAYHRSAATTGWDSVVVGHSQAGDNQTTNIENATFSEMVFYDSDQHGNQLGIEGNINTYYSIY